MSFAIYGHLPAGGLGERDPRRPYATGGIGAAVYVVLLGADGKLIVLYDSPALDYIEAVIGVDGSLVTGINIGDADLDWVRAYDGDAELIRVVTGNAAMEAVFAQSDEVALVWVRSLDAAETVILMLMASLWGAQVPLTDAALATADEFEGEMTGALLPTTTAKLYAADVLSSQKNL